MTDQVEGRPSEGQANLAINQTINQSVDQTLLDSTIDEGVRPSQKAPMNGWKEVEVPQIVEEKDTSSKIYSRNRAKWGNPGDDTHSDFKFAPEVGNNDLTEKEQMSRAYKEMSAAQMEVFSA